MFKPLFEAEGYKPSDKKRLPREIVPPVKESSLKMRQGLRLKDKDGRTIGFEGEHIFMPRKTLMGSRDKMACAGSSVHTRKFVVANGHIDRRLDAPAPLPVGVHTPKKVMGRRMPKPCRRVD